MKYNTNIKGRKKDYNENNSMIRKNYSQMNSKEIKHLFDRIKGLDINSMKITVHAIEKNLLSLEQIKNSLIKDNFDILIGKNIIQTNFDKYEKNSLEELTGLEEYNLDTKVEWKSFDKEININY